MSRLDEIVAVLHQSAVKFNPPAHAELFTLLFDPIDVVVQLVGQRIAVYRLESYRMQSLPLYDSTITELDLTLVLINTDNILLQEEITSIIVQ